MWIIGSYGISLVIFYIKEAELVAVHNIDENKAKKKRLEICNVC